MVAEALVLALTAAPPTAPLAPDPAMAERFARLALACVGKEYPNKISHVLSGDSDVKPPRELTPAFFGCYDWHSAVHAHWLLARLARTMPDAPFAPEARAALGRALTPANVAAEVRYLEGDGRVSFERPYGLAWLLQLAAEIRQWPSLEARAWSATLEPLEKAAADRIGTWLPKLSRPIRIGEHSQTAFAFGLVLDWARGAGDGARTRLLESRIRELYAADRACPLAYEPSGEDFLSPCLGEADLTLALELGARAGRWLPSRIAQGRLRAMAGAGRGDRPRRSEAGPPRRPEPEPGLDARRHGRGAPRGRPPARLAAGHRRRPPDGRPARGHRRALRRWALAGHLRRLPRDRPWPAGSSTLIESA